MKPRRLPLAFAFLFVIAGLFLAPPTSAQTTYRDLALDTGGWVSGFAQHPGGRLYGYGDIFGVHRSDDFGATWRFLQAGDTQSGNNTFIVGLAVSPLDANRVAYSTYGQISVSTDAGDTWTRRLSDLTNVAHTRGSKPLAYHPARAEELWLAANRSGRSGSLWRSTDHGLTWSVLGGSAFTNERVTTIHFFPAAPDEVWVGTAAIPGLSTLGGLWCSADGGATWTKVWNNNGQQTEFYGAPHVKSIARNAARVSVFSTNDGVWQVTAANWTDPATYTATQRTWNGQSIPNVTALANGSFWASEIGDQTWAPKLSLDGVTWTDRQITHSPAYVPEWSTAEQITAYNRVYGRDMLVQDVADPDRWLLTGGAAAHLSEDNGLTFRYQPGGMAGIASYKTTFDRTHPNRAYLATSDRGIFIVNDGGLSGTTGTSSRKTFNELHTFHEVLASADGQILVGAGVQQSNNRTVIIRSADAGASWQKRPGTGLPENYEGVVHSVMSPTDPDDFLVLLGYTTRAGQPNNPGLYRTTDGGANFTKVGGASFDGIDTGMRYNTESSFLERDGINPSVRYLALRAGNNSSARGVWRSTDHGATWTFRTDPFNGAWTWAFAVDPTLEGRLWAGGASLRRSNDGGASWTTVSNFVDVVALDAYAGRLAVRGRRSGDTFHKIYASADHGATWQELTGPGQRFLWAGRNIAVDPWRAGQVWVGGSRSVQIINPPSALDPTLTGTASGSAPVSDDPAFAAARAFDGDTTAAFAPAAPGGHAALDLGPGASARVTTIRFFPRAGFEDRMSGGRFESSADGLAWTTLAQLTAPPSAGWQTLPIDASTYHRHLRYRHPTGLADVAEIEFRGLLATTPAFFNSSLPALTTLVGQPVSYALSATGNPAPTFSVFAGALPAGLSLDTDTGLITGTATSTASGSVTVRATNLGGHADATLAYAVSLGARLVASVPTPAHIQETNTLGTAPVLLTNSGDTPLSWSATLPSVEGAYTVTASTTLGGGVNYEWIDIVGTGTQIAFAGVDDSNAGPITLPFAFPFFGTEHTSVRVCTNGWLSFTDSASGFSAPASLPSTSAPPNLVAPFLTDLYLRTDSGIYTQTLDATTFVISYLDLVSYADRAASNPARYDFQVILKSDGRILIQYENIPDLPGSGGRLIGIQNADRTLGLAVTPPTPTSALIGRAYQFTPPLGWLYGLAPASSSAAGGTLAPGASLTLDALIDTTGIAAGQTRTAALALASNDPVNPLQTLSLHLEVGGPPPLAAFRTTHGLAADGSEDLATPAGDGVANILKYAFNLLGSAPGQAPNLTTPNASVLTDSTSAGLPFVSLTPSLPHSLQIIFIRRKPATYPGITYAVEFSDTLAADSWSANPSASESATSLDDTFERVTVTDSVTTPARRFARVRIVINP